ncbi:hypothetical protein PhCBS80983_g01046 [Powellomyces hirtus]|uniref:tRNA pseudouridine synthase n=1 Tax=Powellomyces hirtus TaxID=109895 RepID=A0A507EBL3_9FUNG|nr:hypothetical protein PhCBS80983_g01046 [Powellomyces hirtus]
MASSTSYSEWSKESLIARIAELERGQKSIMPSKSLKTPAMPNPPDRRKHQKTATQRPFNFSANPSRPIALRISYLGWAYHGLTAQEADTVPTIESHLYHALTTTRLIPDRKSCGFSRCGRTDRGVSAFEQVVGLWIRTALPVGSGGTVAWEDVDKTKRDGGINKCSETQGELDYIGILNKILPEDIRVLSWSPVEPTFDARFGCAYRRYKYFFPADALDISAMRAAAKQYVGVHDFRNFCKVDPAKNITSYERRVLDADVRPLGHEDDENWTDSTGMLEPATGKSVEPNQFYVFVVKGHAFLWHQVRCMMAILYLVGSHKEDATLPSMLMDLSLHPSDSGRPTYDMASEIPLVLVDCGYPDGTFTWQCTDEQSHKTERRLNALWRGHATKAVQVARLIDGLDIPVTDGPHYCSPPDVVRGNGKYVPVMKRPRCDSIQERQRKGADAKSRKRREVDADMQAMTPMDLTGSDSVPSDQSKKARIQ